MVERVHECEYYYGKIQDIVLRDKQIYCRRCGKKLEHSQVNSQTLIKLEQKIIRFNSSRK